MAGDAGTSGHRWRLALAGVFCAAGAALGVRALMPEPEARTPAAPAASIGIDFGAFAYEDPEGEVERAEVVTRTIESLMDAVELSPQTQALRDARVVDLALVVQERLERWFEPSFEAHRRSLAARGFAPAMEELAGRELELARGEFERVSERMRRWRIDPSSVSTRVLYEGGRPIEAPVAIEGLSTVTFWYRQEGYLPVALEPEDGLDVVEVSLVAEIPTVSEGGPGPLSPAVVSMWFAWWEEGEVWTPFKNVLHVLPEDSHYALFF